MTNRSEILHVLVISFSLSFSSSIFHGCAKLHECCWENACSGLLSVRAHILLRIGQMKFDAVIMKLQAYAEPRCVHKFMISNAFEHIDFTKTGN